MGEGGYSNFPFSIVPGTDINQSVGFAPRFAIVSNYSPYYLYFPDALGYVTPWTAGAVVPLLHATYARASWSQGPFGSQSITVNPLYSATISFTDDPRLAPVGGSPIQDPTISNPQNVGTLQGSNTAGLVPSSLFVSARVLHGFSMSCISTVGVGRMLLMVTDPTGVITDDVGYMMVSQLGVTINNQNLNILPNGFQAGNWRLQVNLDDVVGVNTFHWAIAVYTTAA